MEQICTKNPPSCEISLWWECLRHSIYLAGMVLARFSGPLLLLTSLLPPLLKKLCDYTNVETNQGAWANVHLLRLVERNDCVVIFRKR